MNIFTTNRMFNPTREQQARELLTAPIGLSTTICNDSKETQSFFDDLTSALWLVIAMAIVPGALIIAMCQAHTERLMFTTTHTATHQMQQTLQYGMQYGVANQSTNNSSPTPDGFGVPYWHGGQDDTQKQE